MLAGGNVFPRCGFGKVVAAPNKEYPTQIDENKVVYEIVRLGAILQRRHMPTIGLAESRSTNDGIKELRANCLRSWRKSQLRRVMPYLQNVIKNATRRNTEKIKRKDLNNCAKTRTQKLGAAFKKLWWQNWNIRGRRRKLAQTCYRKSYRRFFPIKTWGQEEYLVTV